VLLAVLASGASAFFLFFFVAGTGTCGHSQLAAVVEWTGGGACFN
jgi:hypothetical protein